MTYLRMTVLLSLLAGAGCTAAPEEPAPTTVSDVAATTDAQDAVPTEAVQAKRDGETVLAVGQVLAVSLEGNPSTGYTWEVDADGTPQLALVPSPADTETSVADGDGAPPPVGSPVVRQWHFEAVQPGTTTLRLVYRRPWEKDVAPVEQAEFQVTVEDALP